MKKIIIQQKVYAEVEEAWLYYENIVFGLGDKFLDEWENTLLHIEKYPEHFPLKKKDFRAAPLERFPFIVCFVIETDAILVYGLIHMKRNPSKRFRK